MSARRVTFHLEEYLTLICFQVLEQFKFSLKASVNCDVFINEVDWKC